MKVLMYSHIIPYPLTRGGIVAQFTFLQELIKHHDVIFITEALSSQDINNLHALQDKIPGLHIINIVPNAEKPKKKNILKLMSAFNWYLQKKYGFHGVKNDFDNGYYLDPIPQKSHALLKKIKAIINEHKPDIVQVDFTENADMIDLNDKSYKKILIAHALKYWNLRDIALEKGYESWYIEYLISKTKPTEIAFLNQYDAVIVFSNEDAARLQNEGVRNAYHCGFAIPSKMFSDNIKESKINKLTFIGPDSHYPNVNAVEWYINKMASRIKKKFGLKLHVIGKWSKANMKLINKENQIIFEGFVDNLHNACSDSIMIVPLKIGSGIRTKILDAMAMGLPIISTSVGCEGIGVEHKKEIMIADNEEDFFESIEQLLNNEPLLQQLRTNAHQYTRDHFSPEVVYNKRIAIYQDILNQ